MRGKIESAKIKTAFATGVKDMYLCSLRFRFLKIPKIQVIFEGAESESDSAHRSSNPIGSYSTIQHAKFSKIRENFFSLLGHF